MHTIDDFNFKDKKALIRVDFNVPLNEEFQVTDATRIEAAKPTIIKILEDGGSCILMSHLGRPKEREEKYSLRHILNSIVEILGVAVKFSENCVGEATQELAASLQPGEILLLENLRYHKEEEAGDKDFAQQLAGLGDIYVNDAFGTAHRAHASTAIIAQFFPEHKCFGYLMASEIINVKKVFENSEPPVTAIIGGAKVSSKITVIENILDKVDHLIIGGGMAFTFIKAQGGSIGTSLVEDDKQELALEILVKAKEKGVSVHLPIDTVVVVLFDNESEKQIVPISQIPDGWMGLDVGPESQQQFSGIIKNSKTILFNGPVGVFELANFAKGTIAVCDAIAEATLNGAFSLVGGGDSVAAVKKFDYSAKMSYVSTGGGAMLEMLEGKLLPGVKAMEN